MFQGTHIFKKINDGRNVTQIQTVKHRCGHILIHLKSTIVN